jgi:hypothetical protein
MPDHRTRQSGRRPPGSSLPPPAARRSAGPVQRELLVSAERFVGGPRRSRRGRWPPSWKPSPPRMRSQSVPTPSRPPPAPARGRTPPPPHPETCHRFSVSHRRGSVHRFTPPASPRFRSGDTVTTRSRSGLSPLRDPVTALDADPVTTRMDTGVSPCHRFSRGGTGMAPLAGAPSTPLEGAAALTAPPSRRTIRRSDREHDGPPEAHPARRSARAISRNADPNFAPQPLRVNSALAGPQW